MLTYFAIKTLYTLSSFESVINEIIIKKTEKIKKSAGRLFFVVFRSVFILAKNFKLFGSSCSVVVCRCYLFISRTQYRISNVLSHAQSFAEHASVIS